MKDSNSSLLASLPNAITMGNLLCGLIGIERVFAGDMVTAFIFILIAAILDFFDGFVARLLKVDGEMGKQLDSLADLVTFGVLPGLFFYHYMMQFGYCFPTGICTSRYAWVAIPIGAAFRLARFNIAPSGSTEFVGVPTPIMGIVLASISLSIEPIGIVSSTWLGPWLQEFYFLAMMPVVAAFLMAGEWPMLAFKFKKNDPLTLWKYSLVVVFAAIILLFRRESGIPILLSYVFISVLANFVTVKKSNG
ncbi:MAG: CDP-alcohol phosphatidyltransferase family protein [Bacteroidia bacterium]|nr:CDP-alcohol phosphatidyltransferase family protein [Bacteroidia bacterium]